MHCEAFHLRAELPALAVFNAQLCDRLAAGPHPPQERVTSTILLLLDELPSNVIKYGHPDGTGAEHDIGVRIWLDETAFTIEIEDDGAPFDPTVPRAAMPADEGPWEDRPVGGWGLALVRQTVDELAYRREQSLNQLTLRKRFLSEGEARADFP